MNDRGTDKKVFVLFLVYSTSMYCFWLPLFLCSDFTLVAAVQYESFSNEGDKRNVTCINSVFDYLLKMPVFEYQSNMSNWV